MHAVEFIPANWLEQEAGWPGLLVYSRPVAIERRQCDRVEDLLRSLLLAQV